MELLQILQVLQQIFKLNNIVILEFVDIIFGLQWGDEGKGKISNSIAEEYDMVCRWNGGPNAGHTVYINDKKLNLLSPFEPF